jgi:hypothetical protein
MADCLGCEPATLHGLTEEKKAVYENSLGCLGYLVGQAIISRLIPATPYSTFIPFAVFFK